MVHAVSDAGIRCVGTGRQGRNVTHSDANSNQDKRRRHRHARAQGQRAEGSTSGEQEPQPHPTEPTSASAAESPLSWRRPRRHELSMRESLAIALDGKAPTGDDDAHIGYHIAGRILSPHLRRLQAEIGLPACALFTVINGRYDHLDRVLVASGFMDDPATAASLGGPRPASMPPVLLIGSDPSPATDAVLRRQLNCGGLVVTSDRSANLPTFETLGVRTRAAAATHVRAVRSVEATGDDLPGLAADRLYPALRLSAGHRALLGVAQPEATAKVLVRDVHTREPLVVLWRVGGGYLLHSVAHWWQNETPDRTDLGSRRLRRMPDFRSMTDSDARWGEFQAGYCLLSCLLYAMRVSLTRPGNEVAWQAAA